MIALRVTFLSASSFRVILEQLTKILTRVSLKSPYGGDN